MKRLPLLMTLLALILLAASTAYWVMQLYKPEQRPLAPPPVAARPEPSVDAAATLFGGDAAAAVVSNYQLTGVVSAGRYSVAILVADNAPPKAIRVGGEIVPGVTVSQVYPRYVMLSDGGVMKRVDLATDATAGTSLSMRGPGQPGGAPPAGVPGMPQTVPEPQMSPGALQQQGQQMPEVSPVEVEQPPAAGGRAPMANTPAPPPPPPPQLPEPVRGTGSPVPQPSSAR